MTSSPISAALNERRMGKFCNQAPVSSVSTRRCSIARPSSSSHNAIPGDTTCRTRGSAVIVREMDPGSRGADGPRSVSVATGLSSSSDIPIATPSSVIRPAPSRIPVNAVNFVATKAARRADAPAPSSRSAWRSASSTCSCAARAGSASTAVSSVASTVSVPSAATSTRVSRSPPSARSKRYPTCAGAGRCGTGAATASPPPVPLAAGPASPCAAAPDSAIAAAATCSHGLTRDGQSHSVSFSVG